MAHNDIILADSSQITGVKNNLGVQMTCSELLSWLQSHINSNINWFVCPLNTNNSYMPVWTFTNQLEDPTDTFYICNSEYLSINPQAIGLSYGDSFSRIQNGTEHNIINGNRQSYSSFSLTERTVSGVKYGWFQYTLPNDTLIFYTTVTINNLYYNGNPLITYNWTSVPTISGKMGVLRLPQLFNDTDGEPVSGAAASDFTVITSQSNFRELYTNIIYNEEKIIVYSGENNTASLTWRSSTSFDIKFYNLKSIEGVGFNKWDEEWEQGNYNNSGEKTANTHYIRCKNPIHVIPNTEYYLLYSTKYKSSTSWSVRVFAYDEQNNFISAITTGSKNVDHVSFTIPSNAHYITFAIGDWSDVLVITEYYNDICLNISKTTGYPKNGDYVPYATAPIPIYTQSYTLAHATDEIYFAMLLDINDGPDVPPGEVHRWGRPSMIIKDGTTGLYSYNTESVEDSYYDKFYEWIMGTYTGDYDIWGDPNMEAGGDGYGDLDDDPISDPGAPTIGAIGTGMTRLYWISGANKSKISDLMDWFNDPDLQFVNKIFTGDPIEALIGINLSPLALTSKGTPNMHFLGIDTGIAADGAIADQYQEIDCGTIEIKKWMKNTYLDFAPFTKIKAVLPYVGIIDLDVDDIKGKTLHLKYIVDALTGSCVAHIFVNNSLHYEASGNCFINIPISNKDYSQLIAAEKGAIASVAQTLMSTGGLMAMGTGATPAGAIAMVGGAMVSNAINVAASHPSVRYVGGNTGATTGYMGFDRPFLIVEQPILARPANDQHYFGMPSYITDKIGTFSKFNKFSNMHLESIPCTESERADIETALKNGVIIQTGSSAPNVEPSVAGDYVIVLLHNLSETNTIGKKWKTDTGETLKIEGKLLYDQSILIPSFLISGAASVYTYNYAYVPALHRYYYINDIIARTNDCLQLDMISDPLQSFQDEIKDCKAVCARAEERTNFLINDGALTVQQNVDVKTIQFRKDNARFSFTRASAGFVIIVASGG